MTLLEALKLIREHGPVCGAYGICYSAKELVGASVTAEIADLAKTWPKHSGEQLYPVPHPRWDSPFRAYMGTQKIWDVDTEYGRLRWELLDHCIAALEQQP